MQLLEEACERCINNASGLFFFTGTKVMMLDVLRAGVELFGGVYARKNLIEVLLSVLYL